MLLFIKPAIMKSTLLTKKLFDMKIHIIVMVILTAVISCKKAPKEMSSTDEVLTDQFISADYEVAPQASSAPAKTRDADQTSKTLQSDRKLIKNGALSFETSNIDETKKQIENLCRELGGYISTENRHSYTNKLQYDQVLRLPADKFDSFIEKLEAKSYKIEDKSINTQDVTEEFIDVEARLKTKRDLELRYRELLKFAKTVEEMLSIENEIEKVRSNIESMEGRLTYLKNQVSFSTMNLSYYEITGHDFGFGSKLASSIRTGWDNLLLVVVALVNVWPFLLLLSVAWALFRRKKITAVVNE
jgi:hypothetical protein